MACVRTGLLAAALLLSTGGGAAAQAGDEGPAAEYAVKARFLYHFASFVTWPPEAFPESDTPFTIGVLGKDPFGDALDEVVAGETVQGRAFEIVRSSRFEILRHCHIVYVSRSETGRLGRVVERLRNAPVLTVSDIPGFPEKGGAIGFVLEEARVRFELNPEAAKRAGLQMSAKLLSLGRIVAEERPPDPR